VLEQGRHAALDEDSSVLKQCPDEAPRGQLAQQISEELHEALAVQQLLFILSSCEV